MQLIRRIGGLTSALGLWATLALAGDTMPVSEQNALVFKYCAVCHNDAEKTGGLTLQHFDAARLDRGTAAMLLSKLTDGLPLERIHEANIDPEAAKTVDREIEHSAMGASRLPVPDATTSHALVMALSAESAGATEWTVDRASGTASIVREVTAPNDPAKRDMYRLSLACAGEMVLAWTSGQPHQDQEISIAADGEKLAASPALHKLEGDKGKSAPGSITFTGISLPKRSLVFGNLVGGKIVDFPFDNLPARAGCSN